MTEHYPGSRRILRPGIAAIATLTTSLALLNPVMPVAFADANSTFGIAAQPNVEQEVPESTSALQWGIRNSFVGYVNGATHILDGAKQGPGRTYLWPYQSTTKNPETSEVTIQYGGTVNFLKHCHGGDERPHCDLDFTFGSPKIVINTTTGEGRLYATIHTRDYLSKQWSGPTERHIGNLDANAGRYNVKDGKMHWRGVSATLTKDGNAAFSNFYEEGGFLDSLSFSLDDTFEIGERTGFNLSNEIATDVHYDASVRVFARPDGSVLAVSANNNGKVQLFDKELKAAKYFSDIDISRNSSAAYDPATESLYWLSKNNVIKMATVTNDGLQNITDLAEAPGSVTGFTFSPQRKAVAAIHNTGDFKNPNWQFTIVNSAKEIKRVTLPAPSTVLPNAEDSSELYGTNFGAYGTGLRALPDGSFILLYDTVIRYPDREAESSVPLHIKPDAEENETVTRITAFKDFMHGSRGNFRGIQTDGNGNIAIYSTFAKIDNPSKSLIAFARYNNGEFTVYPAKAHSDALSIAGVAFTTDGKGVIISQDRSIALFLEPTTMDEIQRASLNSNMKDTANLLSDGAVFGADGSLYVLDRRPPKDENVDWRETYGLQRLTPPGSVQQRDPALTAYTMAGKQEEVADDNNTSDEAEHLPPAEDNTPDTKPGDDAHPGTDSGETPNSPDSNLGSESTPGDDVLLADTLKAVENATSFANKAKAGAEEVKKLVKIAQDDASQAYKVFDSARRVKSDAQAAEEAAKTAKVNQTAAQDSAQNAADEVAKAEQAVKDAGENETRLAEAKAALEEAKKALVAANEKANAIKEAAEEARAAANEAHQAREVAEKLANGLGKESTKPNQEWEDNLQHWLENRGFTSPLARILTFFAGLIQAILFPFIALFGGIR
ncbi:MAG: HtaA domain-containing protein [Corynebacterium sp.]|nr:HtaA domain-containing protein [Corynebacterium sp.]